MGMSTPYELTGRTHQKARTRAAMLAATRELLAEGVTVDGREGRRPRRDLAHHRLPLLPQPARAADRGLPRARRAVAARRRRAADPAARLELVAEPSRARSSNTSPSCARCCACPSSRPPASHDALPLRTGRAIGWIEDALAPLRDELPAAELRRLVLAIRATLGIEALVWLTDIAGLSREDAVALMRSSARTLLRAAMADAAARAVRIPRPSRCAAGCRSRAP